MAGVIQGVGRRFPCLVPAALFSSALALDAQVISGRVYDAVTGSSVPGAQVTLETLAGERIGGTLSGDEGSFVLGLANDGRYRISAAALGYRPSARLISVASPDTVQVILRLSPRPLQLDSLTATGRRTLPYLERAGFYRREAQGWGVFYDRPKLEHIPAAFPTHLLRQLRGISTNSAGGVRIRDCTPAIIVDGMHMGNVHLDDVIDPETIQGIEVYDGPSTVPVEFRRGRTCGAVVLWTRPRS